MATKKDFYNTALRVNEYLYDDSSIRIETLKIEIALREDFSANGGFIPSESDMENIVAPEDDGDEETNKKFAHLIALISEQF